MPSKRATRTVVLASLLTLALTLCATWIFASVIYTDSFEDGIVAPEFLPIGGTALFETGGELFAVVSTPGDGISFGIPSDDIDCYEIELSTLSPFSAVAIGDRLTWRWVVVDSMSSTEYTILESQWEQTGSRTFTTFKRMPDGTVVKVQQEVEEEDLDVLPPAGQLAKLRWDRRTRNGTVEVQLEIVFVDATTGAVKKFVKLFDWQDPPGFVSTRIELESSFPLEMSFASVAGADSHQPLFPVEVPSLSPPAVWLLALAVGSIAFGLALRARMRTP